MSSREALPSMRYLRPPFRVVDQYAQERKQIRASLYLVDDDQAAQGSERQLSFLKAVDVLGVLQVEVVNGGLAGRRLDVGPSQRGLAALPRAEDPDDGMRTEVLADPVVEQWSFHIFVEINKSCL